ncbi:hypothetical protein AWENTII_001545 [Aspergillus wentii]
MMLSHRIDKAANDLDEVKRWMEREKKMKDDAEVEEPELLAAPSGRPDRHRPRFQRFSCFAPPRGFLYDFICLASNRSTFFLRFSSRLVLSFPSFRLHSYHVASGISGLELFSVPTASSSLLLRFSIASACHPSLNI